MHDARKGRHRPSPRPEHTPRAGEVRVSGIEAVRALFTHRPSDVRRVYALERVSTELSDIFDRCRSQGVAVSWVELAELTRIADTVKHDGVCVIARRKAEVALPALLSQAAAPGPRALVLLDGVKNPNNVGAIARVCSHFGVTHLLTAGESAGFSTAAMRTAQGAAETIALVSVGTGVDAVAALKDLGFRVLTTSSHATVALGTAALPDRTLLVLGGENSGVSPKLAKLADAQVCIPGAGQTESMNVACAASVLLWEHWRTHRPRAARPAPASTSSPRRNDQPPRPQRRPQRRPFA